MRNSIEAEMLRLIEGQIEADSVEGRRVLEAAGLCLADLEELRALTGQLEVSATERQAIIEAAKHIHGAPGADRVAETLERLATKETPPATKKSSKGVLNWLLPVAGLLMLLPVILMDRNARREIMLGNRGVRVEFLPDASQGFGPIAFEVENPLPLGEVVMLVFDAEEPVHITPLFNYKLHTSPWSDPKEQAKWPEHVHVRVEFHLPGQADGAYGWVESVR